MERYWRPSQSAPWEALIAMRNPRAVMLYHYIESGQHTSRTRVCRVSLHSLISVVRSSTTAVKRDLKALESRGLIAFNITTDEVVTAYPLGSWVVCPARRERVTIVSMLGDVEPCTAVMAALHDLGATGTTDLQVLKNKETARQSKANQKAIESPPVQDEDSTAKDPPTEVDAPQASPSPAKATKEEAPRLTDKRKRGVPKPAAKWEDQPWAPVVEAYREILPHRPQLMTRSLNGKVGKALAKRWEDKPDVDWWRRLFKAIKADSLYDGRETVWSGATLRWLSEPNGFTKASERFHRHLSPQARAATGAVREVQGFEP